ncbi:hypothetical protein ON010_g1280 [Phytophthora cinnamomi]|nr:hypothetical protein ON010_g1280 [Phytophthora cinnamomi]
MRLAVVLRALIGRLGAVGHLAALAATVRPAEAVRHGDGVAALEGAHGAAAVRPTHSLGLGAVIALGHFAAHPAAVLPAALGVLSTAGAAFDGAELAALLGRRWPGSSSNSSSSRDRRQGGHGCAGHAASALGDGGLVDRVALPGLRFVRLGLGAGRRQDEGQRRLVGRVLVGGAAGVFGGVEVLVHHGEARQPKAGGRQWQ